MAPMPRLAPITPATSSFYMGWTSQEGAAVEHMPLLSSACAGT